MNPLLIQIPFFPEQASNFAFEMDLFYLFLVAVTGFFTLLIGAALVYFLIKYRRRSEGEIPEQIEGHLKLEIAWTVIPFVIAMFIFAWGAKLYYQMYTDPKDALEIFVTGKQWMWRAQHPDGQREINELHVPLGRRVKLTMTSEDVIHSYYIPAFRTKTDVVPGRYTTSWFTPTKAGTYHLFCAEYCGTQHSGMIGKVTVMEYSDYQAWLRGEPYSTPERHRLAGAERLHPWYYADAPATVRSHLADARRLSTFDEVVAGLDEDTALFEARRCLSCGNCFECDNCYGMCPDNAVIKLGPGQRFTIDLDYCKGCGICAAECPCGAIDMVPEQI